MTYYIYLVRGKRKDDGALVYYCGYCTDPEKRLREHRGEAAGGAKALKRCKKIRYVFLMYATHLNQSRALRLEGALHRQEDEDKRSSLMEVLFTGDWVQVLGDVQLSGTRVTIDFMREQMRENGWDNGLDVTVERGCTAVAEQSLDRLSWQPARLGPSPPMLRGELLKVARKVRKMFPDMTVHQLSRHVDAVMRDPSFAQEL